jgi:soluble lytic murein transglycosylase-like protein
MITSKRNVSVRRPDERRVSRHRAVIFAAAACTVLSACETVPSSSPAEPAECILSGAKIDPDMFERTRARYQSMLSDCQTGLPVSVPAPAESSPVPVIRIDLVPESVPETPDTDPPPRPAAPRNGGVPAMLSLQMRRLDRRVNEVARRNALDPLLLHALIHIESRHRSDAVSPAGARGAMQLMPGTAERFGVADPRHLHDDAFNLAAGAALLKSLIGEFDGDLDLALAAYNAGEGAVRRYGRRVPPFPETQAYVRDVRAEYRRLQTRVGEEATRAALLTGVEP